MNNLYNFKKALLIFMIVIFAYTLVVISIYYKKGYFAKTYKQNTFISSIKECKDKGQKFDIILDDNNRVINVRCK